MLDLSQHFNGGIDDGNEKESYEEKSSYQKENRYQEKEEVTLLLPVSSKALGSGLGLLFFQRSELCFDFSARKRLISAGNAGPRKIQPE